MSKDPMSKYTDDDLVNIIKSYDSKTEELLYIIKDLKKEIEEIKQTIKAQPIIRHVVSNEPKRYC